MRNIATCYSEHAVKISDSYCSGPLNKSYISPKLTPSIQNHVISTYKVNLPNGKKMYITITWCNKLICQGFFIKISEKLPKSNNNTNNNNSKLGFHQISKLQGIKSLVINSNVFSKVDIQWDLSNALFETVGPVPQERFYLSVTLVELKSVIVIGDMEYYCQNVGNRMTTLKGKMISRCEYFIGHMSNEINSSVSFCDTGVEHEIVIKCGPDDDGPKNQVLSVFVDEKRVVKVKKLQWNFRGNQVIFVDGLLIDVMWDVYGWYFDNNNNNINNHNNINNNNNNNNSNKNGNGNGNGKFMFRIRSGLDSRLWLEEEEKNKCDEKHEFSLVICVSGKNPG